MKLSPRRLVGIICACLAILIACILIGLSVSIVPWNHLALVEDTVKPQIWDKVYGSGRHFIGVGKHFHTFPMDYRLVDFSRMTMATSYGDTFYEAPALVGRTAEGLGVSMAITVFSRIQRERLREMYLTYCYSGSQTDGAACADKVLGLVALYARAAILELVAQTRTEDFFRERVRIVEAMTRVVREAVAPLHLEIFRLSLREVVFDEEVDEAITSKIVTAQSIETKLLEQQTRQVLADKAVLVAEADTEIAWRLAAARAQGSVVEAGAESDAFLVEVLADANATRVLRDSVFARGGDASADLAALAAANDAVLTRQYYSTVLASTQRTRLLIGDELRPTLLAVLPACRCIPTDSSADGADGSADGVCGATGRCQVEGGGACRGTDGLLASYVGPNASDTNTTEVSWWAGCA